MGNDNKVFFKKLAGEWKLIEKPGNVFPDTLFVIASCVVGAGITAAIDFGVGELLSMCTTLIK